MFKICQDFFFFFLSRLTVCAYRYSCSWSEGSWFNFLCLQRLKKKRGKNVEPHLSKTPGYYRCDATIWVLFYFIFFVPHRDHFSVLHCCISFVSMSPCMYFTMKNLYIYACVWDGGVSLLLFTRSMCADSPVAFLFFFLFRGVKRNWNIVWSRSGLKPGILQIHSLPFKSLMFILYFSCMKKFHLQVETFFFFVTKTINMYRPDSSKYLLFFFFCLWKKEKFERKTDYLFFFLLSKFLFFLCILFFTMYNRRWVDVCL